MYYDYLKILNLYSNEGVFIIERNNLEGYLIKKFGAIFMSFKKSIRQELYIQFLSVINPIFVEKNFTLLDKVFLYTYKSIDKIITIQDYISPALIFFPYVKDMIFSNELLDIFLFHIQYKDTIRDQDLIEKDTTIQKSIIKYPEKNIYFFKPDGSDDLIGANVLDLRYKKKTGSRLGYFVGDDTIFVSCIQNRKIGRDYYGACKILRSDNLSKYLFKYFIDKYAKNKKIILFQNLSHNCRIYDMNNAGFIGIYDILATDYNFVEYNNIFWMKQF